MWADRRKRYTLVTKLDSFENEMVREMAEALGGSKGEAVRRAIWVNYILFSPDLKLRDALKENLNPGGPFHKALRPIPELSHILGIDVKLWRRQLERSKRS